MTWDCAITMSDFLIDLEGSRSAKVDIILCHLYPTQKQSNEYPANKHQKHGKTNKKYPMATRLCDWLCLYLRLWRLLSTRRWLMMNNYSLVPLLDHLILCGRVADRAT